MLPAYAIVSLLDAFAYHTKRNKWRQTLKNDPICRTLTGPHIDVIGYRTSYTVFCSAAASVFHEQRGSKVHSSHADTFVEYINLYPKAPNVHFPIYHFRYQGLTRIRVSNLLQFKPHSCSYLCIARHRNYVHSSELLHHILSSPPPICSCTTSADSTNYEFRLLHLLLVIGSASLSGGREMLSIPAVFFRSMEIPFDSNACVNIGSE